MFERKISQFEYRDISRPMSEEDFADIELAIRSLRDKSYEHLIVDFPNKIGKLDFIQTYSTESYKSCYVEIGFIKEEKDFPQIFTTRGDDISVDRTVEIFKSICCSVESRFR